MTDKNVAFSEKKKDEREVQQRFGVSPSFFMLLRPGPAEV